MHRTRHTRDLRHQVEQNTESGDEKIHLESSGSPSFLIDGDSCFGLQICKLFNFVRWRGGGKRHLALIDEEVYRGVPGQLQDV